MVIARIASSTETAWSGPNTFADLVILEKNPRQTAPTDIRNIKVKGTWIDGKPVSLQ